MVRSSLPPHPNFDLINLNPNMPNPTVIPPNLHEAFSLAGVYGENMALNTYANLAGWQTPWYNNFLNNSVRAFNTVSPQIQTPHATPVATPAPSLQRDVNPSPAQPVSNENQNSPSSNESNTVQNTPHFSLPPNLLGSYNNYLAPGIGSLLAQNNVLANGTSLNSTSMPSLNPQQVTQAADVLRNLNVPLNNGLPVTATSQTPSPARSRQSSKSPRYSNRSSAASRTCECPNCADLARRGLPINRQNEKHTCHIPGCLKVYGKSSHLKAHLRWHNASRPAVYQQNRRNAELSHSSVLSAQSAG